MTSDAEGVRLARWPVKRTASRPAKRGEALNALCLSDVAGRNSTPILRPSLGRTPPTRASFALCTSSDQLRETSEAPSNSAGTWAENQTAPRISPRGRRLTFRRRPLVNGDLQLPTRDRPARSPCSAQGEGARTRSARNSRGAALNASAAAVFESVAAFSVIELRPESGREPG